MGGGDRTMTPTIEDIIQSPCWSRERLVRTNNGPRFLRTMPSQGWHHEVMKKDFAKWKAAGLSFGSTRTGKPELCMWRIDHGTEEREDASRASDSDMEIPCPPGLAYLPFQKAGIAYAAKLRGCLIADEMGLGKTVQAIGVLNLDETWDRVLVVCPASLKLNWRNEIKRWLCEPVPINVITSGD